MMPCKQNQSFATADPHPLKKKTLVFIDGHDLFLTLEDGSAQKRQADWDAFIARLLKKDEEVMRIYWREDETAKATEHIANEAPQRPMQTTACMDVRKKKYETPCLRKWEQMSNEYPVLKNITRVQIVRLLNSNPATDRAASRTLIAAGKVINVHEIDGGGFDAMCNRALPR